MTDILLVLILISINVIGLGKSYSNQMEEDIRWLRNYFEKKSTNKWDSTFYDPTTKNR